MLLIIILNFGVYCIDPSVLILQLNQSKIIPHRVRKMPDPSKNLMKVWQIG